MTAARGGLYSVQGKIILVAPCTAALHAHAVLSSCRVLSGFCFSHPAARPLGSYRKLVVKSNRPVNLDLGQVLAVNLKNPVAIVSILHRLSGILVFLLIPVFLYLLQVTLASPASFQAVAQCFAASIVWRLLVFIALAGLIYHFCAGCKHLLADLGIGESLEAARVLSVLTVLLAALFILLSFWWVVL